MGEFFELCSAQIQNLSELRRAGEALSFKIEFISPRRSSFDGLMSEPDRIEKGKSLRTRVIAYAAFPYLILLRSFARLSPSSSSSPY